MSAATAPPAGEVAMSGPSGLKQASISKESAFQKVQQQLAVQQQLDDSDVAAVRDEMPREMPREVPQDRPEAWPLLVSGRMLSATNSVISGWDDVREDIPFDQLCNRGAKITSRNFLVKLNRYTLVPLKEIYLPFMTWGLPTNYLMLTFRTFNRDFDLPNHNADDLAPLLRDSLMPGRGKLHRNKSSLLWAKTRLLDTPWLGLPGIVNFIDVRTQWFDAAVKRAIADGITQVVIIAAGYDTRAYRLGQEGVKFYEVDLPHASEKKQQLVREHMPADKYTWPEFVGADLSKVSLMQALANTSWDSSHRTMFIIEGLVYYLPPEAFKASLTSISETAVAGSRLFFDFLHLDALSGDIWNPGLETLLVSVWNKGEMMYSGIDHRAQSIKVLLKKFGFRLYEALDAKQITARFHPHVTSWNSATPHVSPYFGYIAAEKVLAPFKRKETVKYRG